jgi:Fe-S-cluster containining protein
MGDVWFKDGLRFKCTRCGKCCFAKEGAVFLSTRDLYVFADYFRITVEEFKERYTRKQEGQTALSLAPGENHCVFFKDNQCSVYEARPIQCKAFPAWLHTIESPESWKAAAKDCEGIDHPDAPLIPAAEIAKECMSYLDNLIEMNFAFAPKEVR